MSDTTPVPAPAPAPGPATLATSATITVPPATPAAAATPPASTPAPVVAVPPDVVVPLDHPSDFREVAKIAELAGQEGAKVLGILDPAIAPLLSRLEGLVTQVASHASLLAGLATDLRRVATGATARKPAPPPVNAPATAAPQAAYQMPADVKAAIDTEVAAQVKLDEAAASSPSPAEPTPVPPPPEGTVQTS